MTERKGVWTFLATGRLRSPFAAVQEAPTAYGGYSVSLIEPFLGPGKLAAEIQRVVLDLAPEIITANLIIVRDTPDGPTVARDLEILGESIASQFGVRPTVMLLTDKGPLKTPGLSLELIEGSKPPYSDILLQIRALELYGHIIRSSAIYEAHDAHYQLPSGVHAAKYIRLADIFDDPVVAIRLADWLEDRLRSGTILLADSWTLMPLLQELAGRQTENGSRHPIVTFPEYPSLELITSVLDLVSVEAASLKDPHVLFITSVVGTGHFLQRIKAAASRRLAGDVFEHVVLVSSLATEPSDGVVLALGGDPVARLHKERYAIRSGNQCKLCHDARRSAVILIDHRKYFPHVQVRHQEYMVTPDHAKLHREFWELASRCNAIGVHVDETTSGRPRHLEIDIRAHAMLEDDAFNQDVSARLLSAMGSCDLILIPDNLSTPSLQRVARRAYPNVQPVILERPPLGSLDTLSSERASIQDELKGRLRGIRRIMILDEVLVTGATLRSVHRLIQETIHQLPLNERPDANYEVSAYVVFARPHDGDQWRSLVDSLRDESAILHLASAFCIPMPPGPCPWCEELTLLTNVAQTLRRLESTEALQLAITAIDTRVTILQSAASDPNRGLDSNLFFCGSNGQIDPRLQESITQHSLFGEELGEATAYAAMATAVHAVREEATRDYGRRSGRTWSWRFDKLINVYHDPLLQAALLRSVRPSELLGVDRGRTTDAVKEIMFTSENPALRQSGLLAAEHSLSALMGKYPQDLRSTVIASAGEVLRTWNSPADRVVRSIVALESLSDSTAA